MTIFLAHSALSARAGVKPANDMPGLITYMIGPSAGSFGTSTAYTLITVDEDTLVIAFTGCNYVDVEALHELFDNFGQDADEDVLQTAIQEHTYDYLNNELVTADELEAVFPRGFYDERITPIRITEANIKEAFGEEAFEKTPTPLSFDAQIHAALPPFTVTVHENAQNKDGDYEYTIAVSNQFLADFDCPPIFATSYQEWDYDNIERFIFLEDINFDGYKDLWLYHSGGRNLEYNIYLYVDNNGYGGFETEPFFNSCFAHRLYPDTKQLMLIMVSGTGHSYEMYQFTHADHDGNIEKFEPLRIGKVSFLFDEDSRSYTVRNVGSENNDIIFSQTITESEYYNGELNIDELMEAYLRFGSITPP